MTPPDAKARKQSSLLPKQVYLCVPTRNRCQLTKPKTLRYIVRFLVSGSISVYCRAAQAGCLGKLLCGHPSLSILYRASQNTKCARPRLIFPPKRDMTPPDAKARKQSSLLPKQVYLCVPTRNRTSIYGLEGRHSIR